jgi:chemotaxis protein histidine kinase CheA
MSKRKRQSKVSWRKAALTIIGALLLMFGTASIVNKLLTEPKSPKHEIYTATNPSNDKAKVEPEVNEKQNKDNVPEQGKIDKKPDAPPEQAKSQQPSSIQQPVKSNDKIVDPFIENFLNIYVNLANDSELEFYYLDNVVMKNSNFYKTLSDEIQKLRQAKVKYVLDDFKVESITKGENESELIVQVSQIINKKATKYSYVVYFDKNGVFIKDRK